MATSFDSMITFELASLAESSSLNSTLLNGQIEALKRFGVDSTVVQEADLCPSPGTFAVIARQNDVIIGSMKLCTRAPGVRLPIESEASPLSEQIRAGISSRDHACEIRGLWVSTGARGQLLGRRIIAAGIQFAQEMGFDEVVAITHMRNHEMSTGPLGFEVDRNVLPFPYPDERYQTIVIWKRGLQLIATPQIKESSHALTY